MLLIYIDILIILSIQIQLILDAHIKYAIVFIRLHLLEFNSYFLNYNFKFVYLNRANQNLNKEKL